MLIVMYISNKSILINRKLNINIINNLIKMIFYSLLIINHFILTFSFRLKLILNLTLTNSIRMYKQDKLSFVYKNNLNVPSIFLWFIFGFVAYYRLRGIINLFIKI